MRLILLLVALVASGCADTAELFPMNREAQAIGPLKAEFRRGLPHDPIKLTMPDGEVLNGTFQVAVGGGVASGFTSAGTSFTGSAVAAGGNFFAAASGPRTTLTCQGNVSFGHGGGTCRTQDGAVWQLQV